MAWRAWVAVAAGTLLSLPAGATPYWVAYEGSDFPENEGWLRGLAAGGDQRSLENGTLVLDGQGDVRTDDYYAMRHQPLDPGPGELFRAEWRLGVDQVVGLWDPAVALFSDESWAVGFVFNTNLIYSGFEDLNIVFVFTGMHEFVLTSADMRAYQLFADGILLHQGPLVQVASSSTVTWGDGVQGAASLSRWDYVRFGVVPEPSSVVCITVCVVAFQMKRR